MSEARAMARLALSGAPGQDPWVMAATLPDVVQQVAAVWQGLPSGQSRGWLGSRGGPVASGELDRLVEHAGLLTTVVQAQSERPWSVQGVPPADRAGLVPVVAAVAEMEGRGKRSVDPVWDRVALMEIVHHSAHAANVAIGSRVSELMMRGHGQDAGEQKDELLRCLRVSNLVEEVSGSYGRRARPEHIGGLHVDPVNDVQGLSAALARLDVLTQRHLAGSDRASDLAQVAGPQATIYSGARVILSAGMEVGQLPTNEHLLRRVEEARDGWRSSGNLWERLTPRSEHRPHPELWATQKQVTQALRDTLMPTGRGENAATIAGRSDLRQLTEVMHQHLATVPLHAQLLREAALDPQMRYSNRGIDHLMTTRRMRTESGLGMDDDFYRHVRGGYEASNLGRAPIPLRSNSTIPSPLPGFARLELESRTGELLRASTAAYQASGQSWTERRTGPVEAGSGRTGPPAPPAPSSMTQTPGSPRR